MKNGNTFTTLGNVLLDPDADSFIKVWSSTKNDNEIWRIGKVTRVEETDEGFVWTVFYPELSKYMTGKLEAWQWAYVTESEYENVLRESRDKRKYKDTAIEPVDSTKNRQQTERFQPEESSMKKGKSPKNSTMLHFE